MERQLLLLGLLRGREMHGYQINECIEDSLGVNVQLTKPTVYRLLSSMADKGWVASREEQEGNRPSRRVYGITPQGEEAFQRLLRQSLAGYRPLDLLGDAALLFLDALPAVEALELLRERRTAVAHLLEAAHARELDRADPGWLLQRRRYHLAAELGWVDELIARLGSRDEKMAPVWQESRLSNREVPRPPHPPTLNGKSSRGLVSGRDSRRESARSTPVRSGERQGWRPEID
jgi:DNA-binding PadR family transcriptional regulator